MPRGNGTGPAGLGPMTGRGAGYCAGFGAPGYMTPGGRGFLRGAGMGSGFFGRGAGFRNRFFAAGFTSEGRGICPPYYAAGLTPEEERQALSRQASVFEDQLTSLKKRIAELEAEKAEGEK